MKPGSRPGRTDWLAAALWLVLLAGYLINLGGWRVHDDEGEYLYQAWRMTEGEVPYRDFLTPQLPLFLYAGRSIMALGGSSLVVMRLYNVILVFAAGGLIYLARRKQANRWTGLLAMGLFLTHPDVFKECRLFRSEPLMLLLVTGGLVVATWPTRYQRRRNLALAGVAFGLATMSKLFGLLPAGGVGLWLLWEWVRGRRSLRDTAGDGLALGLSAVLVVALIAGGFALWLPEFFDLVVGHHLAQGSEQSAPQVVLSKLDLYREYLGFYPVFVPLALLSAGVGALRGDQRRPWLWQIPTVLAFLLLSRLLGRRHLMYLLPSLSLLAAWLLVDGLADPRWRSRVLGGMALLAILVPALDTNIRRAGKVDTDTERVVDLIVESTNPGDTILADDIGLAFYSQRPTTYSGAALSHGAVTSGQITSKVLIDELVAANARVVVVDQSLLTASHLVFLRDYPGFHRFLEANFEPAHRVRRDYQELDLWLREAARPFVTEDKVLIEQPDGTRFGETMTLLGYSVPAGPLTSGGQLVFKLFWTSDGPADRYWSVFTHLIGPDGSLLGQHDKVPYDGLYPTNRWWPGVIIDDSYSIDIPSDAPEGQYRIAVGMYDWQSGDRLPLRTAEGDPVPDNLLWLSQAVSIVPPP